MGYAFEVDETASEAVHRITDEQVGKAVARLEEATDADFEAAVHDCRKRAKKLRGLIRLVRPALGEAYAPANRAFRDAARRLSTARDAHAALATFDALVAASADRLPDGGGLGAVRAGLAARADEATAGEDRRASTESAADLFRAGHGFVAGADLDADGWAAIGPGLRRTYRAGRDGLARLTGDRAGRPGLARRDDDGHGHGDSDDGRGDSDEDGDGHGESDPTAMHEWRKRAKDAWYHVRLLRPAAPSVLDPLDDRFHDLADALGDAHDLVVIDDHLREAPDRFGGEAAVRAFGDLASERRAELERRAVRLGTRLYAEKSKAYARRLGAYWRAWHDTGAEEPTGGLADLFPPSDDLDGLTLEALRDRAGEAALPADPYPSRVTLIGTLRARGGP